MSWFFSVVVKMSLRKQVISVVIIFVISSAALAQETTIDGGAGYFLYKDPLGVMVNYTGSIELGNVPHGFGVGIFLDENPTYTYTGEWRHGLATGFGKIQYANGDVYTGETRNRIRYGFGQYVSITGDTFIGQWRNGRKSGFGIMRSWMGHSFIGANENGLMEGFGLFTHSDGTEYAGQYLNDQPVGVHEVSFANGTNAMAMGNRSPNGLNWTILNQQEVQRI